MYNLIASIPREDCDLSIEDAKLFKITYGIQRLTAEFMLPIHLESKSSSDVYSNNNGRRFAP